VAIVQLSPSQAPAPAAAAASTQGAAAATNAAAGDKAGAAPSSSSSSRVPLSVLLPFLQGRLSEVWSALGFLSAAQQPQRSHHAIHGCTPCGGCQQAPTLPYTTSASMLMHAEQSVTRLIDATFGTALNSPERKQYYGLLFSLHKLATVVWGQPVEQHGMAVSCTSALLSCCPVPLMMQLQPAAACGGDAANWRHCHPLLCGGSATTPSARMWAVLQSRPLCQARVTSAVGAGQRATAAPAASD
jgi:hypothetical protein